MASNLFKPEAKRRRDLQGIIDGLISFLILILFILGVIYFGYRVGNMDTGKQPIKTHFRK